MSSGGDPGGAPVNYPGVDAPPTTNAGSGPLRGLFSFLRSHPILCLLLLSPGIPEYLSSSSPINAIVLDPGQFFLQLALNLGLYGPGVLLIREAMVRWNKGWATVLVLGAAYGIVEEGLALSTLFYSKAGPVGQFGYYGHWMGVNWVWTATVVPFHMLFSISLPILLLGLALPATRGRSLLSSGKILFVVAVEAADVTILFFFVLLGEHFWMGYPVFIGSIAAVCALVLLARSLPPGPFARALLPKGRPRTMALLGLIFYPTVVIVAGTANRFHIPAFVDFWLVVLAQGLFLVYILRVAGSTNNEPQLISLAFGLILPIAAIGLIGTIAFPLALVGDAVYVLFFVMLWRKYRPVSGKQVPSLEPVRAAKIYPKSDERAA